LSLASAILGNTELLILDEAAIAVDSQSELLVQEAIERFEHNHTVLVIAQRLSTIAAADQILVPAQGSVVERGSHARLLTKGGLHANLWQHQTHTHNNRPTPDDLMPFDSSSRILITGGTGSFGKAFIAETLRRFPDIQRLVIYSRDELKQWELQQLYPPNQYPQLRLFLGDVRDSGRLVRALEGIDTVVHAAALKQVPAAEYNPIEFIKTNVLGAENLVQACLDTGVKRVVALSTDKAAAPINLYGATKLCSDKLFIAANNIIGNRDLRFSVVRYGNVMGSRGSVIPFFLEKAKTGVLPITDPAMTRFNILLSEGVAMVLWALEHALGGELFVPKIPSYRITDLAEAIGPSCEKPITGIRPGEKIHEEMITASDSFTTIDLGVYYAILPNDGRVQQRYQQDGITSTAVPSGFAYNSGSNPEFLTVDQLRTFIREHVDPAFVPA
jgi:UDP-N-acetylglucosamine 4,6-dehydratase/5-epimerase